jgi:hypothetical protein
MERHLDIAAVAVGEFGLAIGVCGRYVDLEGRRVLAVVGRHAQPVQ